MKSMSTVIILLVVFLAAGNTAAQTSAGPSFSAGVTLGYNGGTGGQLFAAISNFASGFPLSVKGSFGYTSVEPGNAADARRIFINNATNGIPEESGQIIDFRLDFLYPVRLLGMKQAFIVGGPRYSRFKANFKYIGGNEDFDVKSNAWGFGLGLETYFPMSRSLDLMLSGSLTHFPKATLTGHDTSYSPDGDDINPREDYTYETADEAINQPKNEISLMLGVAYTFGR